MSKDFIERVSLIFRPKVWELSWVKFSKKIEKKLKILIEILLEWTAHTTTLNSEFWIGFFIVFLAVM